MFVKDEGLFLKWEPPLEELAERLRTFGNRVGSKYIASALRKASVPAEKALKQNVNALGRVTGNLRRAVAVKIKTYTNTGNAVALIGFKAVPGRKVPPGGDAKSAFHAGLIEFGTDERRTKTGSIASSFKNNATRRAGFKIKQQKYQRGGVKKRMFKAAETKPRYPIAFFARAPKGDRVSLGKTRPYAPIKRAWQQSRSECQSTLEEALLIAIDMASRDWFATL